jgi:hypothetical protein
MRSIYPNFRLLEIDQDRLPSTVQPRDPLDGPGQRADDLGMTTRREIVSIVWSQKGHLIDISYDVGDTDQLEGAHQLAAELAADAGLSLVPTRDGTVRWVKRDPDD